jgi:type I restriction enzyme, S subunit
MIERLKPYLAMRNSGLPWLGDVPRHWDLKRGKNLFRSVDVRSETGDEELLTVSSDRGVIPRRSTNVTMFKAESYVGHKLCWPGDLVINSLWAWARGLGVSRHYGIISSAYGVYRLQPAYTDYSAYIHELVRSTPFNWELKVRSKGIWISRLQLTDEAFLEAPFPIPSKEEQASIVRFLNHANRRIQRYIRAKQALIKLLEEQKLVVIHRAVTRGLDSSVCLKPSGVNWLGDVPEHWELWQIGHFAYIGNGSTPARGNPAYWAGGTYPWLNSSSVNAGTITQADQRVTETALHECHLPRVAKGSVLVAITGQGKTRGTAAVLNIEATINQHIAFITPRSRKRSVSSDYLRAFLVVAYPELRRISDDSGSTKGALTCEDLRHFRVALPPFDEQLRIVQWTLEETAAIESTIDRANAEISLLREFGTRLIADVVTGKLDVRDAATQLPDADESEPLDEAYVFNDAEEDSAGELDLAPEEIGA